MRKEFRSIKNALNFVYFSSDERVAIIKSLGALTHDWDYLQRFLADCAELKDPEGANTLATADDPMYPALVLLSRFDDVREVYSKLNISEDILRDTLSDIPLWMNHCKRVYGYYGIKQYAWLTNYTRLRLFRLGRLEFMCGESEVPAYIYRDPDGSLRVSSIELAGETPVLAPGMPVIEVHIPEGPAMDPDAVTESLKAAPKFFAEQFGCDDFKAFVCESWLMSPCFSQIIPGSNLDRFQSRFFKVPFTEDDSQMFERLYDCDRSRVPDSFTDLPMDTRLRRAMRDHYESGGRCPQMWGVIPIDYPGRDGEKV